MGFTRGLLAGLTLTTGALYLTANLHAQNRAQQAALVASQDALLRQALRPESDNSLSSSSSSSPWPTSSRLSGPIAPAGIVEQAKDRWNREVEGMARRLFYTDWSSASAKWEDKAGTLLAQVTETTKQVGKEAGGRMKHVVEEIRTKEVHTRREG